MTANGADDLIFLLIRGMSAGALHILSGIIIGFGLSYIFRKSWLMITGTMGLYGVSVTLHALYNLMITDESSIWNTLGYIFPAAIIIILFVLKTVLLRNVVHGEPDASEEACENVREE